jgi:hypothetical protein
MPAQNNVNPIQHGTYLTIRFWPETATLKYPLSTPSSQLAFFKAVV